MGEADEHQVQCPPQEHDPQDWMQHAAENSQVHFKKRGVQKHPCQNCKLVCQSQVLSSSKMPKQQDQVC